MKNVPRIHQVTVVYLMLAVIAGTMLAGCGGSSSAASAGTSSGGKGQAKSSTLTVLAASSLTDAFGQLSRTFEKQNPGAKVRTSFGASSTLLTQIQQGAPADVFASADEAKMNAAQKGGLVSGKPEVFARNHEVVIVPKSNPANIKSFKDLAKPGTKLVLAEDGVPAAVYAKEILGNAAGDSRYGASFKKAVFSNIVSRESDVRASVNRVAVGDADATFCYASDVTPDIRDKVKVVKIPKNLNVIATYPIAVLKGSKHKELAQKWVRLVTSAYGQRVLKKWGFKPITK